MFKDLSVNIDSIGYNIHNGYSVITGWALDPVTKEPLEISCDIPALINTVPRYDIKKIFGINRDVNYGFLIQFPGSLYEMNPKFTFSSGDIQEAETVKGLLNMEKRSYLDKAKKTLIDQEIWPFNKIFAPKPTEPRPAKAQPYDRFAEWIEKFEEKEFNDESLLKPEEKKKISAIVLAKNPDKNIKDSLDSLTNQTVKPLEVLIAKTDDYDTSNLGLEDTDNIYSAETISEAANKAAEAAKGEYILFLDNGDILSPHTISEVDFSLKENPEADFLYADSDKIEENGERYEVHFKPDYDSILLHSHNYILHPIIVKKELFKKTGGFRKDYEGLQNFDLILRLTKGAQEVYHIPKILYHWRIKPESAIDFDEFTEEYNLGLKMLKERFARPGNNVGFDITDIDYVYQMINKPDEEEKVTIVIGVLDGYRPEKARKTIEEMLFVLDYPNYEILAVNVGEFNDERVRSVTDKTSKSKAELYNKAAKEVTDNFMVFVEPGFNAIEPTWLDDLLGYALLEDVGIVGPVFFNGLYRITQAGAEIRNGKRQPIANGVYIVGVRGYDMRLRLPHEVFAVNNGCLLVEKDLFEKLEGFNTQLAPGLADLDLAIRARQAGKKSVIHYNVPAMMEDEQLHEDLNVDALYELYPKEELENRFINENLRPGHTAYEYLTEE